VGWAAVGSGPEHCLVILYTGPRANKDKAANESILTDVYFTFLGLKFTKESSK